MVGGEPRTAADRGGAGGVLREERREETGSARAERGERPSEEGNRRRANGGSMALAAGRKKQGSGIMMGKVEATQVVIWGGSGEDTNHGERRVDGSRCVRVGPGSEKKNNEGSGVGWR